MSTTMVPKKTRKRRRENNPMVEGDISSADAVTFKTVSETLPNGTIITKRIMVSMDEQINSSAAFEAPPEPIFNDYLHDNNSPPPQERQKSYRVGLSLIDIAVLILSSQTQADYLQQYVERIDELLEALLSKEAMPANAGLCRHCDISAIAIWRCRDCIVGTPMCRACMRNSHKENPLHRIEQWNGNYYRPAELWEVGSYLLVRHNSVEPECETLRAWCNQLEVSEAAKDLLEQKELLHTRSQLSPGPGPAPVPIPEHIQSDILDQINNHLGGDDPTADDSDILGDDPMLNDELEETNANITTSGAGAGPAFPPEMANYVRVVHTNGLHTIGMVSCECNGPDNLPTDLFAAHLLPTSFKRTKTLFTAQVLDMFRLSNLELKASAYQFYQLLRRMTRPMSPGDVIDLYREFRRMSRLWRWMKKLKWAGYGSNLKRVSNVQPGELAIYCPACPQPGINIPDNWMEDPTRQVTIPLIYVSGD
jgi:CxC2 like cysteine cluster associated with KDZ transposases